MQSRTKEEEQYYKYFPEPDIPTIILGDQFISTIKAKMPELPDERKIRFLKDYALSDHVAKVLIDNKELADFFESTVKLYRSSPNEIAHWIISDLLGLVDDSKKEERSLLSGLRIEPKHIAELVKMIDQNKVNRNIAKSVLSQIARTGEMPSCVLDKMNASLIDSESKIAEAIDSIFELEISAVRDAKHNPNAMNFLLGKVMQMTRGRADPKITLNLIKARLARME
jgi:aspartyl-tRNA(Asn)/glutamyl-tRNA(Gln) amidotransferase subunit B